MDNLSSLSVAACAALDTCQAPTKKPDCHAFYFEGKWSKLQEC